MDQITMSGSEAEAEAEADTAGLEQEILDLETRLSAAKSRLHTRWRGAPPTPHAALPSPAPTRPAHFLLLLSDSALPLGSFAFSSGLESYLAHAAPAQRTPAALAAAFLPASVSALASASLPFLLAAHRRPADLAALDDALDAALPCAVGRRASVAQGRALLAVWDRALAPAAPAAPHLARFARLARAAAIAAPAAADPAGPAVAAHLAPLFGAVAAAVGLAPRQAAYVFVLGHVKAVVSAAVRAGVVGPYQAQRMLASGEVQAMVEAAVEREWDVPVEEAGQSIPVMDLWIGRHEMLYSRIFNS